MHRSEVGGRRATFVAAAAALVPLLVVVRTGEPRIDIPTAVVLGLVEGLTEFLPVSSTGHLTVVERLLGVRGAGADSYVIVIQAGAILAVLVLYRGAVRAMAAGAAGRDADGRRLLAAVAVAFVPAALVGVAVGGLIKEHLFGVGPVAIAWAAGGVVLLVVGRRRASPDATAGAALLKLELRGALLVGLAQAIALWPGVSRSLVTIVAGVAVGLSLPAAVEFSFLLGLVTLGAATAYEAFQGGGDIVRAYGLVAPAAGFAAAFVSAVAAMRWMVAYLERGRLAAFGYYRLAAAAAAAVLLAAGLV